VRRKEQTMAIDGFWQVAMQLLRPTSKAVRVHLELMSNEDLDHWLEVHHLA
jgi:hypothetical protein